MKEMCREAYGHDQSRARKQAGDLDIYHDAVSTRSGPLPDGRDSVGHSRIVAHFHE